VLNFIVPVFDLGRSHGNVKSGKGLEKVWKFIFKIRRNSAFGESIRSVVSQLLRA